MAVRQFFSCFGRGCIDSQDPPDNPTSTRRETAAESTNGDDDIRESTTVRRPSVLRLPPARPSVVRLPIARPQLVQLREPQSSVSSTKFIDPIRRQLSMTIPGIYLREDDDGTKHVDANLNPEIEKIGLYSKLRSLKLRVQDQLSTPPQSTSSTTNERPNIFDGHKVGFLDCGNFPPSVKTTMAQLVKFAFCGSLGTNFMSSSKLKVEFDRLSQLSLSYCSADRDRWGELLRSIEGTLVVLNLKDVVLRNVDPNGGVHYGKRYISSVLPKLEKLRVENSDGLNAHDIPLEIVAQCHQLKKVVLSSIKETSFKVRPTHVEFNNFDVLVNNPELKSTVFEIDLDLRECEDTQFAWGDPSRFKGVNLLLDKIRYIDFRLELDKMNRIMDYHRAMTDAERKCPKLEGFGITLDSLSFEAIRSQFDAILSFEILHPRIHGWDIRGIDDEKILREIFEKSSCVRHLRLNHVDGFNDGHLELLIENKIKFTKFVVHHKTKLNPRYIMKILKTSGKELRELILDVNGWSEEEVKQIRQCVLDHCKMVEYSMV